MVFSDGDQALLGGEPSGEGGTISPSSFPDFGSDPFDLAAPAEGSTQLIADGPDGAAIDIGRKAVEVTEGILDPKGAAIGKVHGALGVPAPSDAVTAGHDLVVDVVKELEDRLAEDSRPESPGERVISSGTRNDQTWGEWARGENEDGESFSFWLGGENITLDIPGGIQDGSGWQVVAKPEWDKEAGEWKDELYLTSGDREYQIVYETNAILGWLGEGWKLREVD